MRRTAEREKARHKNPKVGADVTTEGLASQVESPNPELRTIHAS
jgi:hypothetical protein